MRQYFLEKPSNGAAGRPAGVRNARPRVLDPPIYFVNFQGRQLSQVKGLGNFEAVEPNQRYPTGLAFFFEDSSNEDIGGVINRDDTSDAQTIDFQVDRAEAIADMLLYYAFADRGDANSYKLCGLQVICILHFSNTSHANFYP